MMYENGTLTKKEYEKAEKYELIFTNSEKYEGSQVTKDDEDEEDKEYTDEDIKVTDKISNSDVSSYSSIPELVVATTTPTLSFPYLSNSIVSAM